MSNEPIKAEIILYQPEGANIPVPVRYMDETLSQTSSKRANSIKAQLSKKS